MKKITQNLTKSIWHSGLLAIAFLFSLTVNSQDVGQEYLANPGINTTAIDPDTGYDASGTFNNGGNGNYGGWGSGTGGAYATATTNNGDCHSPDRMFRMFKTGGTDGQFINQTITALPAGNYNFGFWNKWDATSSTNVEALPTWSAEDDITPKFSIKVQNAEGVWVAVHTHVPAEPTADMTWTEETGTWTNDETRDVRVMFYKNGGTGAVPTNLNNLWYIDTATLNFASALAPSSDLALQGILDIDGGFKKGVHVRATADIADLSIYKLQVYSNANATAGASYTLSGSALAGDDILIAHDGDALDAYMSISTIFDTVFNTGSFPSINGDDSIELLMNDSSVEVFGNPGTDGTDQPWEYQDSWAYKVAGAWTYGGVNCTDGSDTTWESSCVYPLAIGQGPADPCEGVVGAPAIADDFDGNLVDINEWVGDNDVTFAIVDGASVGATSNVLQYVDPGTGFYANLQLRTCNKFDMQLTNTFTMDVYIDGSSVTGGSPNQVAFKLQNSDLGGNAWQTQIEQVVAIDAVDTWQTVEFNFTATDAMTRDDFDQVVIQFNSEANNDSVTAYIDNLQSSNTLGGAGCDHTFVMNDSYGDGWNGALVDIVVGGVTVASDVTPANAGSFGGGSTENFTFSATEGETIELNWTNIGSYASEISWSVLDGNDGLEIGSGSVPTVGTVTVGTANCTPASCVAPTNLTVSGISTTGATLSWDSDGTAFMVELQPTGSAQGTAGGYVIGDVENITTTSVTIPEGSLAPNTSYDFFVINICGEGDLSEYAGPSTFYTGYCQSIPTSNDNDGINEVVLGDVTFTSGGDITYEDFTATAVDVNTSGDTNLQITFGTGYGYDTHVWIDLNNDLVYDNATELLYSGESTGTNPTTLDASFQIPEGTVLGNYNMRIGTADMGQATPNPCYSGTYGVTVDMVVNVVELVANVTFNIDTANITVGATGMYVGGGVLGGSDAYAMSDDDNDGIWSVTIPLAYGTTGNYIFFNGPTFDQDWGTKEDLSGQSCADTANFNDRILPEIAGDMSITYCFATCEETCPADPCEGVVGAPAIADDFDGNLVDINEWVGDNDVTFAIVDGASVGATSNVLQYVDPGTGFYANLQLRTCNKFDMQLTNTFTMDVYIDGSSVTGGSPNQVAFKLQNSDLGGNAWQTQIEQVVAIDAVDTWQTVEFNFTATDAMTRDDFDQVVIQFNSEANNDSVTAYIDNLQSSNTLGLDDVDPVSSFNFYPNPVNDMLTIKAQASIDSITVYNMLGQAVVRSTPNTTDSTVDMSALQAGAYFVQVSINNTLKTVRVVKN